MQPLIIDLKDKKIVIAGGGKIAARKAKVLQNEQANITFIAPIFSAEVKVLAEENSYRCIEKEVEQSDFEHAFLCILATNNRALNEQIGRSIASEKLVCVVDELEDGNTIFPATITRGRLQIAVSSNGSSPKLTRKLKKDMESQFDGTWNEYTEFLLQYRKKIKELSMEQEQKNRFLQKVISDDVRMNKDLQTKLMHEITILSNS